MNWRGLPARAEGQRRLWLTLGRLIAWRVLLLG